MDSTAKTVQDGMQFDYYYGVEAEQFSFYRVPRLLIKDERFKGLSSDAKLLYGLMLDRMSLSMRNGWLDTDNRAYIYYTLDEIMDDLGCAREKCAKIIAELDDRKGIGLIQKKRQGLGKPDIIYVMNFASAKSSEDAANHDKSTEVRKSNPNYTDNNQTEKNQTEENQIHLIHQAEDALGDAFPGGAEAPDRIDGIDEKVESQAYIALIKDNIEYDHHMSSDDSADRAMYQELFELICDIVCVKHQSVRIGGEEYPYEVVKSRFLKLDSSHLEYVIDCMKETTTKVGNIRAYLLTALYNAPSTMKHYYQQEVNHDLYGGGWAG